MDLPDDFMARCSERLQGLIGDSKLRWRSHPPVTLDSIQRAMDMVNGRAPDDEPRLVVVVDPERVRELQSGLVERGIKDVLVKPDLHGSCREGQALVIDPGAMGELGRALFRPAHPRLRNT